MDPRKPIHTDHLLRIKVYAEDNYNPDFYTVLFGWYNYIVTRKTGESSVALYKRVCDEIQFKRKHALKSTTDFAQVFAGIRLTEADMIVLDQELVRETLRHLILNGKTSEERVNAAIVLGKLIGIFPPEVALI